MKSKDRNIANNKNYTAQKQFHDHIKMKLELYKENKDFVNTKF